MNLFLILLGLLELVDSALVTSRTRKRTISEAKFVCFAHSQPGFHLGWHHKWFLEPKRVIRVETQEKERREKRMKCGGERKERRKKG